MYLPINYYIPRHSTQKVIFKSIQIEILENIQYIQEISYTYSDYPMNTCYNKL